MYKLDWTIKVKYLHVHLYIFFTRKMIRRILRRKEIKEKGACLLIACLLSSEQWPK